VQLIFWGMLLLPYVLKKIVCYLVGFFLLTDAFFGYLDAYQSQVPLYLAVIPDLEIIAGIVLLILGLRAKTSIDRAAQESNEGRFQE
jgi:hypothetical protein